MSFASKLKSLREQKGLTQGELAELSGMSKGGFADLEQGRYEPSWATVQALCKALGIECAAFQGEDDTPPDPAPRGRPSKPKEESDEPKPVKRGRGRPKKTEDSKEDS